MDDIYRTRMPLLKPYTVLSQVRILAEVQDYNIRLMNIPAMWRKSRGEGIKVVILDTGLPKHMDLQPIGGKSFIAGYLEDKNGHGTHCAGIVAATAGNGMGVVGIAPDCEDYYGAVMDESGSGTIEQIIAGIRWAVDEVGADIISMSLGIPCGIDRLRDLELACNYAYNRGVAVFAAAGNEGGEVGQPACYDSVISVAAVNNRMEHADFSNFGSRVDFATGGVDVYSTYLNNSYAKLSGTSMATPALAAVAALVLGEHRARNEKLTPTELKEHLRRIAFDVGPSGYDEFNGAGIPIFGNGVDPNEPDVAAAPVPVIVKPPRRSMFMRFMDWFTKCK